jgi:hypothetical protein
VAPNQDRILSVNASPKSQGAVPTVSRNNMNPQQTKALDGDFNSIYVASLRIVQNGFQNTKTHDASYVAGASIGLS